MPAKVQPNRVSGLSKTDFESLWSKINAPGEELGALCFGILCWRELVAQ